MSTSDAKKAEFARLFDLFERLASRRARPLGSDDPEHASADLPTSQELDPVLEKLSAIVGTSKNGTRLRRNTVSSITASDNGMPGVAEENAVPADEDDDIASLTEFPLANAKKYPFTFRLMVHKLYKKDDWAKTIKEMLERSKNEFKPLAEQEAAVASEEMEEDEGEIEEGAGIKFKVPTSPGMGGKRSSVIAMGRPRSQSIAGAGHNKLLSPVSPALKSPGAGSANQPDVRALKKRCVGRRKSMGVLLNAENGGATSGVGKTRGTWVYDAAVSSAERPVATTFSTFPPAPPPSPTSPGGYSKYQALGSMNLPSTMQGRGGAGMKRRVSTGAEVPLMMPLQHVTNTNAGGLAARRRVMLASKMDEGSEERKPLKRSFMG
ncbi:hypothetical protein GALMADRAFT_216255 [Galerina marginata CBS 339.88]|uniref:Uncharacterized protein n=1 Tax=Galerina marginata (strain CBS 339.88) TaxID=685588 RepID=A0A067S9U5_GALM3|nr:hypothetical protein GALMADRAFT_216255 [Galerina marginata CBS 339.88]